MGLSVEYSSLVITHIICKATLILTVVRWVLCWALKHTGFSSLSSHIDHHHPSSSSSSSPSESSSSAGHHQKQTQMILDSLHVANYGDISWRLPENNNTCAVCLSDLKKREKVRELRNCTHVFHRRCIDRWVDHDDHNTCPLCRAPLLPPSLPSTNTTTRTEPSWAVERLLYLFGDDLL